jgi:hypothetical protein
MVKRARILGVIGIAIAGVSVACGGRAGRSRGSTPPADFAALRAEYTSPSGSLASSDIGAIATALSREVQTAGLPAPASARVRFEDASGSLSLQGLPIPTCGANGTSCSCPGGGSFTETGVSSQSGVVSATLNYDACVSSNSGGQTVSTTGSISFADYQTAPPMTIYSGALDETKSFPRLTRQRRTARHGRPRRSP